MMLNHLVPGLQLSKFHNSFRYIFIDPNELRYKRSLFQLLDKKFPHNLVLLEVVLRRNMSLNLRGCQKLMGNLTRLGTRWGANDTYLSLRELTAFLLARRTKLITKKYLSQFSRSLNLCHMLKFFYITRRYLVD